MKDKFIAAVLLTVMVLNFFDVLTDLKLGIPAWHIFEEAMIVCISGIVGILLIFDIRKRTHEMHELKAKLDITDIKLKDITDEMATARKKYSQVIHDQFELWQLTKSEQEIAMLLLKGLSFKEMSTVRETKEKTVRQQASTIYSKACVEGRHDFAAWFLEDFIADTVVA